MSTKPKEVKKETKHHVSWDEPVVLDTTPMICNIGDEKLKESYYEEQEVRWGWKDKLKKKRR